MGLTELFLNVPYFFQGLYISLIGIIIIHLEFRTPPLLYTYCSSFFSFLGRGIIYGMIAVLNFHGGYIRVSTAIVVAIIAGIYATLEYSGVRAPVNMRGEVGLGELDDGLDDVI